MPASVLISAGWEGAGTVPEILRASGVAGWQSAANGVQCLSCSSPGYAIQVVDSPEPAVLGGGRALRLERRPGDDPMLGGVAYGPRCQVQWAGRSAERAGGGILAVRLAMAVDRSDPVGSWNVLGWQWHAHANGSPPIGFYREGNRLVLDVNRWGVKSDGKVGVIEYGRTVWSRDLAGDFGALHVYDVLWNPSNSDTDGWISVRVDGADQTMADGTTRYRVRTAPPSSIGCYSIVSNYSDDVGAPASVLRVAFFGLAAGDWFPGDLGAPPPPPADTAAPTKALVQPAADASFVGAVPVRVRVADPSGVAGVRAGLNIAGTGVDLEPVAIDEWGGTVLVPPVTVTGRYWLWTSAVDAKGNTTPSPDPGSIPLTVAAAPTDPPPDPDPDPVDLDVAAVKTATVRAIEAADAAIDEAAAVALAANAVASTAGVARDAARSALAELDRAYPAGG